MAAQTSPLDQPAGVDGHAAGIHVDRITYTPPGAEHPVLREVSLTLAPREFVAVLGHNGSGKSTLARHLNGLLTPQQGAVDVDGLSTACPDDLPLLRRRVGLIFQNPDHQIVGASVAEDVLWGMPAGISRGEALLRTDEALRAVGLDGYEAQATWRLSGGQKQRLALAGVLARGPHYLVCDEPTALLDGRSREEARRLLLGCRDRGIGLLWITHRLDEALLADRLLVLEAGVVVDSGTPRELIARRDEIAGSLPSLFELARVLREAGVPVDDLPRSPASLAAQIDSYLKSTITADGRPLREKPVSGRGGG
jgi:energy-coupling factor transport system ATP-binding protein